MKKESVTVEIRAAEGGDDACLLVNDMTAIYKKAATINSFSVDSFH